MHGKPLIALNADYRSARKDQPAFCFVHAGYFDAILRAGGVPVVVPPMADEDVSRMLDAVSGVVFVGGADLDPRRDGYMSHPSVRLLDARREDFDRRFMDQVARRKTPVLGIGTGMQLINVSQGGNLMFHIPEDMPTALPHKDTMDGSHRHALEVIPGTLMQRVYADSEVRVNSMHHMAVDELATGFIVSARCPDGVVEAIESVRPDWWAVGVQFHPEAESASALDQRIFEEFVEAAAGRAQTVAPRRTLQLVA